MASKVATESPDPDHYKNRFRSSQQRLIAALQHRTTCFHRLQGCIEECAALIGAVKSGCDEHDLCGPEALKELRATLRRQLALSLIVFGRSNTGKSTLLNQILREWPDKLASTLFPTAAQVSTARITVTACSSSSAEKVALLVDPQNPDAILVEKEFNEAREIRSLIELKSEQRDCSSETRKLVNILLPSELLRSHLQLVDSPGMGENADMNEVVRNFLSTVHSGIVVYVVDGKEGYRQDPDCENIKFLMEQPNTLQKLIVANRIDFDAKHHLNDISLDELDIDCDTDDVESLIEWLQRSQGFDYPAKCRQHFLERLNSIQRLVLINHPGCIHSGTDENVALLGLSAKSVNEFIHGTWKLPHAPYLDSFLQFESQMAALVHANCRYHMRDSIGVLRSHLMRAEICATAFKLLVALKASTSQVPIRIVSRAVHMVGAVYKQITGSLTSLASIDCLLDFDNPDNELGKLRDRFVQGGALCEQTTELSLAMRKDEVHFIKSLIALLQNTKNAVAAIRLLSTFKDAVVSHLRTWLKSGYERVFVTSMFRLSFTSILDGLSESEKLDFARHASELTDMLKAFESDGDAFSEFCASHLAVSMRDALPKLMMHEGFKVIVEAGWGMDWRRRLLDFFLNDIGLQQQTQLAVAGYCEKIREKKAEMEAQFTELLQILRDAQASVRHQSQSLKQLRRKLAVMNFYLNGLVTEVNWTADYEIDSDNEIFIYKCNAVDEQYLGQRMQQLFSPRETSGPRPPLDLRYRLIKVPSSCLKRLVNSTMQLSHRIPSPVQLSWLCLDSSHADFTQGPMSQVLLAFDNVRCSLADLQPAAITDPDRMARLHSLLDFFAKVQASKSHYRPLDYRPSNVMISISPSSELTCSVAVPDPTYLVADAGQAPESASLAACVVTLFEFSPLAAGDGAAESRHDLAADWDAHYTCQLQQALANPAGFVTSLTGCLCSLSRHPRVVGILRLCVEACLSGKRGCVAAQAEAVKSMIDAHDHPQLDNSG